MSSKNQRPGVDIGSFSMPHARHSHMPHNGAPSVPTKWRRMKSSFMDDDDGKDCQRNVPRYRGQILNIDCHTSETRRLHVTVERGESWIDGHYPDGHTRRWNAGRARQLQLITHSRRRLSLVRVLEIAFVVRVESFDNIHIGHRANGSRHPSRHRFDRISTCRACRASYAMRSHSSV